MVVVGNGLVRRVFRVDGGVLRTERLQNLRAGSTHAVSADAEEFFLELVGEPLPFAHGQENPRRLTSRDFRVESAPRGEGVLRQATFGLRARDSGLRVQLEVEAEDDRPWLRKRLRLRAGGEPVHVAHIGVEALCGLSGEATAGGFGQPVLGADWFAGVEYPTADNRWRGGVLTCAQDGNGLLAAGAEAVSETAVWGGAEVGGTRQAFLEYLDAIRARPVRRYVHYNSWYDLQGEELTEGALQGRLARFVQEMRARGVDPAGFVVDAHWARFNSLYETNLRQFPHDFRALAEAARAAKVDLGLWFGPAGGYGEEAATRVRWAAEHGYEVTANGKYLCLAGRRYAAALREKVLERVRALNLGYVKLDGMAFTCLDPTHGHPAGALSRQAQVKAFVQLLEAVRAERPDVFLSITTGAWLSPWWLRWADAVFIGGADYGWEEQVPHAERRDAAITYRDGVIYNDFRVHGDVFPPSSLMSVGVIKGRLNRLGDPHEPRAAWRRELLMEVGRGIMQTELYITPDLLAAEEWDDLAAALAWAQGHDGTLLGEGEMVLGDPRRGEVYGYVHRGPEGGLVVLRNSSHLPRQVRLPLAEWFPRLGREPHVLWRLHPGPEALALDAAAEPAAACLRLAPWEVVLLACHPRAACDGLVVAGAPFRAEDGSRGTLYVPAGGARVRLYGGGARGGRARWGEGWEVEVGPGATAVELPGPAEAEVRWNAAVHASTAGGRLEVQWAAPRPGVELRLAAVEERDGEGDGDGPALALSGEGLAAPRMQRGPDERWSVVTADATAPAGTATLRWGAAAARRSLWLHVRRRRTPLPLEVDGIRAFSPPVPFPDAAGWSEEAHCVWSDT
jgi:hypothetical protein